MGRRVEGLGKLTLAQEADIAEQVVRAGGELPEKPADHGVEFQPGGSQAMQAQDLLAELAPELLNGIEPPGRSRQPEALNAGQLRHHGVEIRMGMNGPVVLHDDDAGGSRIGPVQSSVEQGEPSPPHHIGIDEEHPAGPGIEHGPVINGQIGWIVGFRDPDGIEVRLYTLEAPFDSGQHT
jgi:hypothetical protein